MTLTNQPFYDPEKSYDENYDQGPFGAFGDGSIFRRDGAPMETFLGHPVYQPFGIPAGPLLNAKFVRAAFQKGFDVVVYKTVRSRAQASHPWPNVLSVDVRGDLTLEKAAEPLHADRNYHEPLSITNSFGVPSKDPAVWQPDMAAARQSAGTGQVLIGSFQGTNPGTGDTQAFADDYGLAAKLVAETGVKILETNLSCPNEGSAHLVCFDLDASVRVVEAIKKQVSDRPLILKIAYFQDDAKLRAFVERIGRLVEGISAINTIAAPVVDDKGGQALPGDGRLRSGVCGAAIQWAGREMVSRLKHHRDALGLKFTIIGVGGVTVADDYQTYRDLGADAVMSATGAMWNPFLAQQIWQLKGT